MADIRRNTKEANQVYQMARQAISQNGSIKDTIAGFLRDFEVDGMLKEYCACLIHPCRREEVYEDSAAHSRW